MTGFSQREDAPNGQLYLTVARVACERHRQAFRATWPVGWPQFTQGLYNAVVNKLELAREAGFSMVNLGAVLDRKPLCEFADRDTLMTLYRLSGLGLPGRCLVCLRDAPGSPYYVRVDGEWVRRFDHVCLECVLDAEGELTAA